MCSPYILHNCTSKCQLSIYSRSCATPALTHEYCVRACTWNFDRLMVLTKAQLSTPKGKRFIKGCNRSTDSTTAKAHHLSCFEAWFSHHVRFQAPFFLHIDWHCLPSYLLMFGTLWGHSRHVTWPLMDASSTEIWSSSKSYWKVHTQLFALGSIKFSTCLASVALVTHGLSQHSPDVCAGKY